MVVTIKDSDEKRTIAKMVLEALTEWFEVEENCPIRNWTIRDDAGKRNCPIADWTIDS